MESGKAFQIRGAPFENALDPYVFVLNDLWMRSRGEDDERRIRVGIFNSSKSIM